MFFLVTTLTGTHRYLQDHLLFPGRSREQKRLNAKESRNKRDLHYAEVKNTT